MAKWKKRKIYRIYVTVHYSGRVDKHDDDALCSTLKLAKLWCDEHHDCDKDRATGCDYCRDKWRKDIVGLRRKCGEDCVYHIRPTYLSVIVKESPDE